MQHSAALESERANAVLSPQTVGRAAYTAAALNLAAALAMLLLLQPGLPVEGSTLERRMAYLAGQTGAWWLGWLFWHAATIGLLGFYAGLAWLWGRQAPIRCTLAVLSGTAGLAVDLGAQSIYMGIVPSLEGSAFVAAELAMSVLSGYVGNGMYTLAGALLVWVGWRMLPWYLVALSLPVWLGGIALSAAALVHSSAGQFWSTAILMPSFVIWSSLMGRWLSRHAS
jgi:hypothetical protein